jgi:BMFP domain-containing protein YqiC
MAQRDLISRLADRGEEMLGKFAETPGASRVLELLNSTRERLDDLQKRVIGLEDLERRLDQVEARLEGLEGGGTGVKKASASTPAKAPAAKKPTAAKKATEES